MFLLVEKYISHSQLISVHEETQILLLKRIYDLVRQILNKSYYYCSIFGPYIRFRFLIGQFNLPRCAIKALNSLPHLFFLILCS